MAIGEAEGYPRIRLRAIDQTTVGAGFAFDLAHLLAELLDNATRHSPAETEVEVMGAITVRGDYRITIVDHGPGIPEAAMAPMRSARRATTASPMAAG
ncbi:MAG: ATP-binding protein [Actinomycetota bacterium]